MGELSIKIKIGDREYPMKVEAGEEERIRKAARKVNEQLQEYYKLYGTTDKQDLLAIVAFDVFVEKIEQELAFTGMKEGITERLVALNKLIAHSLA